MGKPKKGKGKQQAANSANQATEPTKVQSKPSDTVSQTSTQVGTQSTMPEEKREVGQEELAQHSSPKLQQEVKREESLQQPSKIAQGKQVDQPIVEVNSAEVRHKENDEQGKQQVTINKIEVQEPARITENIIHVQHKGVPQKVQEIFIKQENTIQKEEIIEKQRIPEYINGLEHRETDLIHILEDTKVVKIDQLLNNAVLQSEEKEIIKKEEDAPLNKDDLIQENQQIIQKVQQKNELSHEYSIPPIISHKEEVQKLNIHESSQPVVLLQSQRIEEFKKQETVNAQERANITESHNIQVLMEQTVQLSSIEISNKEEEKSKPVEINSDDVVFDLSKPIDLDSLPAHKIQQPLFTLAESHEIQSETQKSQIKSQIVREAQKEIKIEASQSFSDLNYSVEKDQINPTRSQPVNLVSSEFKQPQTHIVQEAEPIKNQTHTYQILPQAQPEIQSKVMESDVEHVKLQTLIHKNHSEPISENKIELKQPTEQETKQSQPIIVRHEQIKVQKDLTSQEHHSISDLSKKDQHSIENLITHNQQVSVERKIEDSSEVLKSEKIEQLAIQVKSREQPKDEELVLLSKSEDVREEPKNDAEQKQKQEKGTEKQGIEEIKQQRKNEEIQLSNLEIRERPSEKALQPLKVQIKQEANKVETIQQTKVEQIKEQIKKEDVEKPQENQIQFELVQDKIEQNLKQHLVNPVKSQPKDQSSKIDDPKEPIEKDDKKIAEFGAIGKLAISVGLGVVLGGGSAWLFQNNSLRSAIAGITAVGATVSAFKYLIS